MHAILLMSYQGYMHKSLVEVHIYVHARQARLVVMEDATGTQA
jgi:hypothetical protein